MKNTSNINFISFNSNKLRFKNYFWFTLVELIVVIMILSILWIIAFLSFNNQSSTARDSTRLSDISNMKKWLEVLQVRLWKYPIPDGTVLSWTVNWQALTYVWDFWNNVSGIIKMNKIPLDPLTNTMYSYWITTDNKYYQISSILENSTTYNNPIINNTYAATLYARVDGNYPGYIKYKVWNESFISNVPSIIFNNPVSVELLSTWTFYVVNNKTNLPYNVAWTNDSVVHNIQSDELIRDITNSTTATLTWVNITAAISMPTQEERSQALANLFVWSTLESFNVWGWTVSDTNTILWTITQTVLWTSTPVASSGSSVPSNACTWLPTNWWFYWNATSYIPTNTWVTLDAITAWYLSTPTINTCKWKCKTGYTRSWNTCIDSTAPTWWTFTMASSLPIESSSNIPLVITCPTDVASSAWEIQMYLSWAWLASWTDSWESCVSSKSISTTAWTWSKAITIKWRDGAWNMTSATSRSVTIFITVCTAWTMNVLWMTMNTLDSPVSSSIRAKTSNIVIPNWIKYTKAMVSCQSAGTWYFNSSMLSWVTDNVTCNSWFSVDWPNQCVPTLAKNYYRSARNTMSWPWWYALTSNTSNDVLTYFCTNKWNSSFASKTSESYSLAWYQESWWYACYCTTMLSASECNYVCPSSWTAAQTYLKSITCN